MSGVVVDSTARRQGHAQAMLRACEVLCERYRRPYVVLDVLAENEPALKLYERMRYRPLRDNFWFSRTVGPDEETPQPRGEAGVRPFRQSDGVDLAELDNSQMTEEVRSVIPRRPKDFQVDRLLQTVQKSETEAWVLEVEGQLQGFVRATVSPSFEAALLNPTLFPAPDRDEASRELLMTSLRWIRARGTPRVVTELPQHRMLSRAVLESVGFKESFQLRTLVRELPR